MPYKDKEQRLAAQKRYNAKPHRKKRLREYSKEYRRRPEVKARQYAAAKKWLEKPENLAARAAYAAKRRADGKVSDETKARQTIRKYQRMVELAGRPRPKFCDVCGGNTGGIVFDHCHKHGHFRGWICLHCNCALGFVKDDISRLRKLIAYVKRNRENTAPQLALAGI